ncbi:MAG TPA: nodulation protein NfeD [Terriglobales bacterium]|nr:nodulation protein NfeD [Terriglobales bacterium]
MTPAADGPKRSIRLIEIDSSINPATADFIRDSVLLAEQEQAAALVIQLDTPGGLLESAKAIVKDLLGAPVPVLVYVAPSGSGAVSAGVFVTMAGHIAAMAPGTNIGAAHPVNAGGDNIQGDMRTKVENFTATLSKSIASERGRNVEWAEKAVRESVSINEREALEKKVIDIVAVSLDDLLRQAHGRKIKVQQREVVLDLANANIVRGEMPLKQQIIDVLANPNLAYLLMMAGMLGLYVEMTNPGLIVPGVAGAISLLLGFAAMQVLPINYSGLGLIGLGIALLVAELFLPSFGVLGVGGLTAFVLGSLLLFDGSVSDLRLLPSLVYAAAAAFGAFTIVVGLLVVRSHKAKVALGSEGLIGQSGEVRRAIGGGRSAGKVLVQGEYWNAVAGEALEVGAAVEVVRVDGMVLEVRRKA